MNKANIILFNKPLGGEPVQCEVPEGAPLGELFPDIDPQIEVVVNDRVLHDYDYKVRSADSIVMMRMPAGDTDTRKNIAGTAAILAVQIGAAVLTSGLSTVASAAITAAATIGAQYGIKAVGLVPTPDLSSSSNTVEFKRRGALTGSRNRISPYGPVPRVYGKVRFYPPMSANPYTETIGNVQYMRLLFNLGRGPLQLGEPKIGDTTIGSFDSDNNFTSNNNFEDVEIEVSEQPSNYSNDVEQDDVTGTLNDTGNIIRTTASGVDEATIDLVFPRGLFTSDNEGNISTRRVGFTLEYRETGDSEWISANGYKTETDCNRNADDTGDGRVQQRHVRIGDHTDCSQIITDDPVPYYIGNDEKETYRSGINIQFPSNGQYDIRLARLTSAGNQDPEQGDLQLDEATWATLKSITHRQPTNLPGTVQVGMKIKATDQLNGVLDEFSVEVQSRLSYHDGSSWQHPTFDPSTGSGTGGKLTSSPAWVLADLYAGDENKEAVSYEKLDAAALKYWADNYPSYEYNAVIDDTATVAQLAKSIAAAGRAAVGNQDGLWGPILDEPNQQPVGLLTDRNTADFSSSRVFPEELHGMRVRFRDEDNDYKETQKTVFADGFCEDENNPPDSGPPFPDEDGNYTTGTKFTDITFDGVTSWDQIHKLARFKLAERTLRPETYTRTLDAENIRFTRGDLILSASDVVLHGGGSGRIKSITRDGSNNVTSVTVDDVIEMETGETYFLYVQQDDGTVANFQIDTDEGEQASVTLTSPDEYAISEGDLYSFGQPARLKIIGIEPQNDLTAKLTMVDEAPDIYDADSEPIPDYDPQITLPPDFDQTAPPVPTITDVRSDDSSLYKDDDGTFRLRMLVSFTISEGNPTTEVEARYRSSSSNEGWVGLFKADANLGVVSLPDVARGKEYVIQIRSRYKDNVSEWEQYSNHTVEGKQNRPSDITGYSVIADQTVLRHSWDEPSDSDIEKFEIRRGGTDWDDASLVGRYKVTEITTQIPSGDTAPTYRIKAIDTHGNESESAASANISLEPRQSEDPVRPSDDGSFLFTDAENAILPDARVNLGLEIGTDVQAHDATLDDVASNDGSAALDLASLDVDNLGFDGHTISSDTDIILDAVGDVLINGDTIKVDKEMTTTDNVIVLNDGETGSGITAGEAGLQFDRGTETDYEILFQESNQLFSIGEIGNLQAVATRPDSPDDMGLTFWNDSENWIETDPNLTFDGSVLSNAGLITSGEGFRVSATSGDFFNANVIDDSNTAFFRATDSNDNLVGYFQANGLDGAGSGCMQVSGFSRVAFRQGIAVDGFSLDGYTMNVYGTTNIQDTLTGTEVDLSSTLDVGGVSTFDDDVILGNQATSSNHALRADRTLQLTSDDALNFDNETARNLTTDLSWALSVEDHGDGQRGVITAGAQDIYGAKTFEDNLFAKGTVGSPDFASRTTDWQVTKAGAADFRSVFSDSIITKAFTADVAQAFRGSRFLTKSFATVKDGGFTIPAVDSTVSVTVADVDGFTGLEVFEQDDYVLVQLLDMEWQGDGLLTGEVWGEITSSITDNGDGTQTFDFTVRNLSAPELEGEPIQEGNEMLSFGSASDPTGFIHDTVLDDAGSPYSQVITWDTNPWDRSNWDIRLRSGILDGITGLSGAGVYTENFYGTESILIGDLDQAGNYIEYENGVLTVDGILQVGGSDVATEAYADQAQSDAESYADGLDSTLRGTLNGILDDAVTNDTTIISGGFIETSFINTDAIAVGDLSDGDDYALETYVDTAESDAIATSRDDVAQRLGFSDYANMYDLAADGETLIVGGVVSTDIIDTHAVLADVGTFTDSLFIGSDQEHILDGANNEVSFSDGLLTADGGAGSVIIGDASKSDPYLEAVGTELNAVGLNLDVTSLPRVSDEGIECYVPFENSAIDGSERTSLEGGSSSFSRGIAGLGADFNGTSDGYQYTDLSQTEYIICSIWFDAQKTATPRTIFQQLGDNGDRKLRINSSDELMWHTRSTSGSAVEASTSDWTAGRNHVVFVQNVDDIRLYLNGELVDENSTDGDAGFHADFSLGYRRSSDDRHFDGQLDEFRAYRGYDIDMSEAQLAKTLYLNPSGARGGVISTEALVANQGFFDEIFAQDVDVTGTLTMGTGGILEAESGAYSMDDDSFVIDVPNLLIDSTNEEIEVGSVFSADGANDEGNLANTNFNERYLWAHKPSHSGEPDPTDLTNMGYRFDANTGEIYNDAMGGAVYAKFEEAEFGADDEADFLDNDRWVTTATASGDNNDDDIQTKLRIRLYKRFGVNRLRISGNLEIDSGGTGILDESIARCYMEIENESPSEHYEILSTSGSGATASEDFSFDLDISSLSDNQYYTVLVRSFASVDGNDLNDPGDGVNCSAGLREDLYITEST